MAKAKRKKTNFKEMIDRLANDGKHNEIIKTKPQLLNNAVIVHKTKYSTECDKIAFDTLKVYGKTVVHLCVALNCARTTVQTWIEKYPSFRLAISQALIISEAEFRDKLALAAFNPSKDVNLGLLKMIGLNVYGIEESKPTVIINNYNGSNGDSSKESANLYADAINRPIACNNDDSDSEIIEGDYQNIDDNEE